MATANPRRKKMVCLALIIASLTLIAAHTLKKRPMRKPLYNTNQNTLLQTQAAPAPTINTPEPAANTAANEARVLSSESMQNNPTQTNTRVEETDNTPNQNYNAIAAPAVDASLAPDGRPGENNTGE